jgi:hypothetical protein
MRVEMFHSEMFLREDGIIQLNTKNHNYTLQNLKEINQAQRKICHGGKLPVLIMAATYANIEDNAREYAASKESTQYSTAEGFVLKSLGQRILANFYLKVNKPEVPTRFFSEEKQAVEWLRSYLPSPL